MTTEKVFTDVTLGPVVVRRSSRARRISIRISPRTGVSVTVPWFMPYAAGLAFLASRKEWVKEMVLRQSEKLSRPDPDGWHPLAVNRSLEEEAALQKQVAQLRQQAKKELPPRLAALAATYGFTYNRVTIKHNRSNWGSCSRQGNINLNLNLVRLPDPLRDYVLLHELCHLRHPDHGPSFHALLDSLCRAETGTPARELEKGIRQYHLL